MEQTRLSFTSQRQGTNYIDLTKALTLVNGKHYTQFKSDKPQVFTGVMRTVNTGNSVKTAPTSWAIRNGLVKTAAAWRAMLRKAGVSKKELNTYGKELRLALDTHHRTTWGGVTRSGLSVIGADLVPDHLLPTDGTSPVEFETGLNDDDGNPIASTAFAHNVTLYNTVTDGVYREHAFDLTQLTVPGTSTGAAGSFWQPFVIGAGQSTTAVYIGSRNRGVESRDDDLDVKADDPDNYLNVMLADNEESQEDVIADVKDLGDYKPYSLDYQNHLVEVIKSGANVAGQDTTFGAPLGLLQWDAEAGDEIIITISGQMDM